MLEQIICTVMFNVLQWLLENRTAPALETLPVLSHFETCLVRVPYRVQRTEITAGIAFGLPSAYLPDIKIIRRSTVAAKLLHHIESGGTSRSPTDRQTEQSRFQIRIVVQDVLDLATG